MCNVTQVFGLGYISKENTVMKKNRISIILILILITGSFLLLYPSVKGYYNSMRQSQEVISYAEQVDGLTNEEYEALWDAADAYNKTLSKGVERFLFSETDAKEYNQLLNISGEGIMAYIEIPGFSNALPIYHGTSEDVLNNGIGHLQGSSLPIGGKGSHCVLYGNRGLPNAKLFFDLENLEEKDVFMIRTLDTTLTYVVDQIRIVLPHEINDIEIVKDEDLCTLVTSVADSDHTHRLLVRGHRVENIENTYDVRITADAVQLDTLIVAQVLAILVLLLFLVWIMVYYRKRR